jgi:hypothetical protein
MMVIVLASSWWLCSFMFRTRRAPQLWFWQPNTGVYACGSVIVHVLLSHG